MVQVGAVSKKPEKGFKAIPCPRCEGSGIAYCFDGEDANQPDPILGDQASTLEDKSMVA